MHRHPMRRLPALLLMLCLLLPALAASAQSPAAPVAGTDYVVIDGGQPWQPLDGKIEVVEIFAYSCGHCAVFAPMLDKWKRGQPADVRVSYLPVTYESNDPAARAFFAAQSLGVLDKTHLALFSAMHTSQTMPHNPSEGELLNFYADQGVSSAKLANAMSSPQNAATMARAHQFMLGSGLQGTPTLVINGKYRVQAPTHARSLEIAGQLIAMARAAAKPR